MVEVHSTQELVDSLQTAGDKLVVVDFYAPGCSACTLASKTKSDGVHRGGRRVLLCGFVFVFISNKSLPFWRRRYWGLAAMVVK